MTMLKTKKYKWKFKNF